MIRLALEHVGYEVETATDGEDGLKKATTADYDLVLVDQRMPGLSGMEIQKRLSEQSPQSRLIMITAFGTIDLALDAIHAGASDFLRKPFTAETLRTAVKSALDRPIERHRSVPIGLVCREFTRTTINGYSFDVDTDAHDEHAAAKEIDKTAHFLVRHGDDKPTRVTVVLPCYVVELVKAYIDSDQTPGGEAFWAALAEEALANHLWQQATLPAQNELRLESLDPSLQGWIDSILTIDTRAESSGVSN